MGEKSGQVGRASLCKDIYGNTLKVCRKNEQSFALHVYIFVL